MNSMTKMESKGQELDFLFHPRSIALVGIPSDLTNPLAEMFLRPLFVFWI